MPQSEIPTSASLQAIEAAALQLLHAVRNAGKGVFSPNQIPPVLTARAVTVAELFNEFLIAKYRAGRSDNYVGLLLKELRSFAEGRAVASITSGEIEIWLHGQGWASRTKRGRLLTLRNVLSWAVTRGELIANPALGVDIPTDESETEPPAIHTPDEVKHVLETARKTDLNTMRFLAIRYFAGLRSTEAANLEEKEIGERFIEVTAAKSKTRRRCLVTIQPNLREWLNLGGELPLRQLNNKLRAVTRAINCSWPQNVTRHSFVSYHLAEFQSAGKTALEAGHSEQML